jgi:hypothetical protein
MQAKGKAVARRSPFSLDNYLGVFENIAFM